MSLLLALDCEMVGDSNGEDMLARVSIVNRNLETVYDSLAKPLRTIADYRTQFSGIKKGDLDNAPNFYEVQQQVRELLRGAKLVGHSLHHDLAVLNMDHPASMIKDVSVEPLFRQVLHHTFDRPPGLKTLARRFLGETIQDGTNGHDSIEDAKTAMKLYLQFMNN